MSSSYTGRFAPSPSGPLHFGSLITAVASYLQARSQQGVWRVRIDDIDPPREISGASQLILDTLQAHGLLWDGEVHYQSRHYPDYDRVLTQLAEAGLSYRCQCTRRQIRDAGGIYTGRCREAGLDEPKTAVRLLNRFPVTHLEDRLLGQVPIDSRISGEDFIIHRKDGLYAYHLASVVDDINMGISEIVRGADLLFPTACQLALLHTLNATPPGFVHVPVAASKAGFKLSKQNHARALDNRHPSLNLLHALQFLGQQPPATLQSEGVEVIIQWAIQNWTLAKVPRCTEIVVESDRV